MPLTNVFQDTYWATEEDPERYTAEVRERIDSCSEALERARLYQVCLRNWRFYHGMQLPGDSSAMQAGIRFVGDQGELVALTVPQYRALLQHILMLVVGERPELQTIAVNSDHTSLEQTRLGGEVLNYYFREQKAERTIHTAAEHALIFLSGFVRVEWDPTSGRIVGADPFTGQVTNEGDLKLTNPTIWDLAFDPTCRSWQEVTRSWLAVRSWVNRWDLMAIYPDLSEKIRDVDPNEDGWLSPRRVDLGAPWLRDMRSDRIPIWDSYHAPSPALPFGRHTRLVSDTVLYSGALEAYGTAETREIPIYRTVAGETLMTAFGYSQSMDIVGLQQILNNEYSSIGTNHKQFGVQSVWSRTGSGVHVSQLEGLTLIESDEKPEAINFTQTPAEIFKFADMVERAMEGVTGINAVRRGQPEASYRSGSALALVDAKAAEINSGFKRSVYQMLEDVGTCMLKVLQSRVTNQRMVSIVGRRNQVFQRTWQGSDLSGVDRVRVTVGSMLLGTVSGRLEIARDLLQNGVLKTPEEYLTVATTGSLEPLFMADQAQLTLIHDENERLSAGENVEAGITDNHQLHVREHMALLASVDARRDQVLSANVLAHAYSHMQMAADPEAQMWAAFMGWPVVLPPMPGAAPPQMGTAPGGSKPGDTGAPKPAQSAEVIGATTPRSEQEPGAMPQMPKLPGAPNAT